MGVLAISGSPWRSLISWGLSPVKEQICMEINRDRKFFAYIMGSLQKRALIAGVYCTYGSWHVFQKIYTQVQKAHFATLPYSSCLMWYQGMSFLTSWTYVVMLLSLTYVAVCLGCMHIHGMLYFVDNCTKIRAWIGPVTLHCSPMAHSLRSGKM